MSEALYNRLKLLREARDGQKDDRRETGPATKTRAEGTAESRGAAAQGVGERSPRSGESVAAGAGLGSGIEGWERLAPGVHRRYLREEAPGLLRTVGTRSSYLFPEPGTELRFFDCETTSLSGGAGNVVFLFGLGRLEGEEIVVEQLFLEDFPDEPFFVEAIADRLSPELTFVSYNGRAFDANVLRTRFLLNGVPFSMRRQVDLLYPARRLWRRRLESCSLGSVERSILGLRREADVPGSEVPERYFEYLRSGDFTPLQAVFSHHAYDISTLVKLADLIDHLAAGDVVLPPRVYDGLGLANMLVSGSNEASLRRGIAVLETLIEEGRGSTGPWADGPSVARQLARLYRGRGEIDSAGEVWKAVHLRTGSLEAAVEYAKYLEHRKRRYDKALEVVSRALPLSEGRDRLELLHRQARLMRRIASSKISS